MRYQYHIVKATESLDSILAKYNLSLEVFIRLNKHRYPNLLYNPYMIFEGNILMVTVHQTVDGLGG